MLEQNELVVHENTKPSARMGRKAYGSPRDSRVAEMPTIFGKWWPGILVSVEKEITVNRKIGAKFLFICSSIILMISSCGSGGGSGSASISYANANPLPVLAKDNLTYLGAFRVPQGSLGGASGINAQTLKNGDVMQPIAFNPSRNSLFIMSYPVDKLVVEISIPELVVSANLAALNTASLLQVPVDPTNGNWDNVSANGSTVSGATGVEGGYPGGLLVYNNKLIGTSWLYYDASGTNGWRSHFTSSLDWVSNGTQFSGLYSVGTRLLYANMANGGFVGGYMTKIPSSWQSALGGTVLTGVSKIPIVSRGSLGPSLWSFDPGLLGTANPTPATALVSYPIEHPTLGMYSDTPSLLYNRSGGHSGVVFPEGTDSIFVIGHHGLGIELDSNGVPVKGGGTCTGAGTSNRSEVKTNAWLTANSPSGWACGATSMTSQSIASGDACCLDPANTAASGIHSYPYVVGTGQSCYGLGTTDISQVRSNLWLKTNSPGGWLCGAATTTAAAIIAGDGCCYDLSPGGTDKGGKSFPYVYQIWRYNANDLAKVKIGATNPSTGQTFKPWDIIPDVWTFDLPFSPLAKAIVGATYDSSTQRIFIAQKQGDGVYPLIHVFKVNIPTTNVLKAPLNLRGTVIK